MHHIEGLIAAPFTPMNDDCSVNLEIVKKQVELLHRNGVGGAFVCGTTGEGMSLTTAERKELAQRWVETAPDGFKVIVHVGHTSLEVSKSLAAHAQETGAWGIGAIGPCFFKPEHLDDLVAFSSEIASAASDLPFYYYHIPSMTGVNFPMLDFLKAAADRIPNLAGIKYTWEDLMDYELCRQFEGGRFDMLFGRDELLICSLVLGTRGVIGSTYNFAAPLYCQLVGAFETGNLERARNLQHKSMEMIQLLNHAPCSFPAAAKAVMKMVGVDCGPVRPPLRKITPVQFENLQVELQKVGFSEYCSK